jgi:hypothetical protein
VTSIRRLRWSLAALLGLGCALVISVHGRAATVPLSISIQGNHFVNSAGQTVRLLGVNHPSFEYACDEGYAYDDGMMDAADAAAISSWHATAVRVPLNEDCWLGINGDPSNADAPDPPLTTDGYRAAVEQYVKDLNDAGLYVILDLHWTAPGALKADGQRAMPDDHSAAFWSSVASTFAANPAVVFDAFNEPFSPAQVNDPAHPVSWDCWKSGGCTVPVTKDSDQPNGQTYSAVGMQALVDAIRGAGARQPILLGGLAYANDLTGWLAHEPSDPGHQLAASFHNYQGQSCDNEACWDSQIAPVAAQVPVVTGEFDQDVCQASTFDNDYMKWADQHGVGYLAWGWWVLSQPEIASAGCSAYYLITDPQGTPAAPNGVNLHDHLAALFAAGGGHTTTTTTTTPGPTSGSSTSGPKLKHLGARLNARKGVVRIVVKADQKCSGQVTGKGIHRARFKLLAGKTKTILVRLTKRSRQVLAHQHKLKLKIAVALSNSAHQRHVAHRTLKLAT